MNQKIMAIILFLLALPACGTLAVTSLSKDGVSIEYDPWGASEKEVTEKAHQLCGEYNKKAKLRLISDKPIYRFKVASFDCIE
jgi:hypothetical protein